MSNNYAVLGVGRQGIAAAYDLAKFGEAQEVRLIDIDGSRTKVSSERVNQLLERDVAVPIQADIAKEKELSSVLDDITTIISAVPYQFNLSLTKLAIRDGLNMCDLGGNTEFVKKQLELDQRAKEQEITIVPDCGMGPGMNISMAVYAMSLLDNPKEVYIWDGGLPQDPKPPWNYALTFNIGGLTNEYSGHAYFLRDGKITEVPCFEGYEELDFPHPLNKLEAFVTSGGLSTMPWTFLGKLHRLENKTLRYPGHWAQFRAYAQLGLLETDFVKVGDSAVKPRDVLHALLEPKIIVLDIRDICVIRVKVIGEKEGKPAEAVVELMDYYDEETGFSAMQRMTGWHASIVAILETQNKIRYGVVPIETVSTGDIVRESKRRGFSIKEQISTFD
jgi:lysine 6-dehydrogenase